MNWTIRLIWNGTIVLDGIATAVCACDMASDFLRGNFAGVQHSAWVKDALPGVLNIARIQAGEVIRTTYSDATGVARVEIKPR